MSLMTVHPWSLLNQLQRELNQVARAPADNGSDTAVSDWAPAVDIVERDDAYVIRADIPGVDPKDIEIDMEDGVLTIKGERKFEQEEEKDNYKRVERVYGSFYRRFVLPDSADAEKITAKSRNGVLEVVIPKQEKVKPRRIEVEG